MTRIVIRVEWMRYDVPWQEKRDRIILCATLLRDIHPLLAQCSPGGKRNGYKAMLQQPSIWDMSEFEWYGLFDQRPNMDFESISFWNRETSKTDASSFTVLFHEILNQSHWHFDRIPQQLIEPAIMMDILDAVIIAFDATIGKIVTFDSFPVPLPDMTMTIIERSIADDRAEAEGGYERFAPCYRGHDASLWQLWLKDGEPWPVPWPPGPGFIQRWQSEIPSEKNKRLGGTLHTWPEYAPWLLGS
jgi:hypothetical protein